MPGAWRAAAQEASHSPIGLSSWAHFVLFAGLGTVAFAQPLAWPGARVVLSAENKRQLWIPPGFAQGFLTLSDSAEFLYKTTDYWYPEDERCLLWNDTTVGIKWPLVQTPLLAAKDLSGKLIGEAEVFAD